MKEVIGWGSAMFVLPTFGVQAWKQWKARNDYAETSSLWFFIFALTGVVGQIAYSWMIQNWVYFVVNVGVLFTDILGLGLVIYRRQSCDPESSPPSPGNE